MPVLCRCTEACPAAAGADRLQPRRATRGVSVATERVLCDDVARESGGARVKTETTATVSTNVLVLGCTACKKVWTPDATTWVQLSGTGCPFCGGWTWVAQLVSRPSAMPAPRAGATP